MTDCVLLSIIFFGLLVLAGAVILVWVAVVWTHYEHSDEARRIKALRSIHQSTMMRIDDTADYYAGLFRYISRRLNDEIRRRQSS